MGYQATVVIHLDALNEIRNDPDFGRKLADAIQNKASNRPQGDHVVRFNAVSHRGSSTAGCVVAVHHASDPLRVETGGNTGRIIRSKRESDPTHW